ncbi:DMT family transporter [Marinactinospora thermotolerans]|uniref:Small multidrug resistance pump n=1 Tax=Marinactinospora thermotolerans DSM 45154 TaxID=1122192 RepID=A0A1T4PI10_9ACTN|nr:multidrug efflux SMR transporter [Marinactinospora thermotolerans]SJZ91194.1 small multidrug resistance pump [Marinactinospora thermotolerans DSM 45154]
MGWAYLFGAILSEVAGTMALRLTDGFRAKVWIAPMLAAYLLAFTLLSLSLRTGMPVGVAYGIWAAVGVALTALLARLLFKDPLTWRMGLGIVAIIGGVLLVETGAHA